MKIKLIVILFFTTISATSQKLNYDEFIDLTTTVFELKEVRNTLCNPDSSILKEYYVKIQIDSLIDLSETFLIFNKESICGECNSTRVVSNEFGNIIFVNAEIIFFWDEVCYFNPSSINFLGKKATYKFIIPTSPNTQDRKAISFEVLLKRTKKKWKIKKYKSETFEDYKTTF